MKRLTYEIVIEREADPKAGFSVYCPDIPGCFSNGGTVAQAKKNMVEALTLHLDVLRELGKPVPKPRHRVVIEELTIPLAA